MTPNLLLPLALLTGTLCAASQTSNLVRNGDFATLEHWQRNEHLAQAGQVSLTPAEKAVTLSNPVIDLDGSLYQDIATDNHPWFAWSVRARGAGMHCRNQGSLSLSLAGASVQFDAIRAEAAPDPGLSF